MPLKERIESSLTPFASRIPLSPNILTIIAVLAMAAAAWAVIRGSYISAAALVIISGFLDMLDGTVAKSQNKATPFGALLDRVGDRISDALIFGAITLAGIIPLWLGLLVLIMALLGSYASACIEAATKTKIGEKLSMRAVRLLLVVVGLLLASFIGSLSYLEYVFCIIAALAIFALAQRLWTAKKLLARQ